jgi:hypothetical protein
MENVLIVIIVCFAAVLLARKFYLSFKPNNATHVDVGSVHK